MTQTTTATLPRQYGQQAGEYTVYSPVAVTSGTAGYVASRRKTGTEVHLTSVLAVDGKLVSMANTTLCNGRSGSNVRLVQSAPTCEKCLYSVAL